METGNRFDACLDKEFLRVVLLDSSLTVCQSLSAELRKDNHISVSCTSREEANQAINAQKPDLLIIGYLGDVSCLEIFREYTKQSPDLPIVLLSHTPEVNQFFREWVISHGGYDVVSWFPEKLNLLREVLQRLLCPKPSLPPIAEVAVEANKVEAPIPTSSPAEPIQKEIAAPPASPIDESLLPPSERALGVKEVATPAPKLSPPVSSSQTLTYSQALAALNQISESSLIYFGGLVIGNYWKKALASIVQDRPWLQCWSINHTGVISLASETNPEELLTNEQFLSLQLWVKAFIKECDRIIGEYTELLQQSNPSKEVSQIIA